MLKVSKKIRDKIIENNPYSKKTEKQLINHGFKIVIYANHMLRASYPAMLNVAKKIVEIVFESYDYGIYHITDKGRVSYYEFIEELAKLIGYKEAIGKSKESDFPTLAPNPLKVALNSIKQTNTNYTWKEGLRAYINDEKITC